MSEPLKDKPKEEKGFSDRELMTYVVVFALTGFTLGVIGVPSNWAIPGAAIGTIVLIIKKKK